MTPSKVCIDLLKAWEGIEDGDPRTVRLDPYLDPVGIWTIGYGRALVGRDGRFLRGRAGAELARAQYPRGISMEEAESLLAGDANSVASKLKANSVAGTQAQFDAFVSLAFNIGVGSNTPRTGGFMRSTLLKLHREGAVSQSGVITTAHMRAWADRSKLKTAPRTIPEAFTAYSFAGGRWMLGLFRRRVSEFMIYRGDSLEQALKTARGFHG